MIGIRKISSVCGFLAFCAAIAPYAHAESVPLGLLSAISEPAKRVATGTPAPSRGISFVLQAKISGVDRQFEHESFNMHSVVKASVFAFKAGDDAHKVGYERLWFHDGKAIGVEKRRPLEIAPGTSVAIQVVQTPSPTSDENKASANLVMRLVLDNLLHKNEIAGVTVPANSFSAISQELQFRKGHLLPEGEAPPTDAHVIFQLNAENSNMKQTLYWI